MSHTVTTGPERGRRLPHPNAPVPTAESDALTAQLSVTIGGTPVHLVDEPRARHIIVDALHENTRPPLGVCSVNLDHVHYFGHTAGCFADSDAVRWLNLIDGAPIATQARRMTGVPYPRLAGSDLIAGILDDLAAEKFSVAVVGGSADETPALRERLRAAWPGVRFAGHWTPERPQLMSDAGCTDLAGQIRDAHTSAVLVCLGKPRQENWISVYGGQTGARALFAFGAVVDFLAGRVSPSPRWVSTAHGEWLWRLVLEPRRLARRYLVEGPPAYLAVRASERSPSERGSPTEHGPSTSSCPPLPDPGRARKERTVT